MSGLLFGCNLDKTTHWGFQCLNVSDVESFYLFIYFLLEGDFCLLLIETAEEDGMQLRAGIKPSCCGKDLNFHLILNFYSSSFNH